MALSQHDLIRPMESLRTADGIELVRVLAQRIPQELIEAEATAHIGAEPGEHAETRTTWRDGHREKLLTTQAGDLDLATPKVRTGSFFPSLLERRSPTTARLTELHVCACTHVCRHLASSRDQHLGPNHRGQRASPPPRSSALRELFSEMPASC